MEEIQEIKLKLNNIEKSIKAASPLAASSAIATETAGGSDLNR